MAMRIARSAATGRRSIDRSSERSDVTNEPRLGNIETKPRTRPTRLADESLLAGRHAGTARGHDVASERWPRPSPTASRYLRIPRRLITSRYFFRLWSRRYFSRLDRFETIISSPRRLAWSLACVLK